MQIWDTECVGFFCVEFKDGDDSRGFHNRNDRVEQGGHGNGNGGHQQNRNMSGRSGGHRGGNNGERERDFYRRKGSYDSRDGSYGNGGYLSPLTKFRRATQ